jgi:hypothetical protein
MKRLQTFFNNRSFSQKILLLNVAVLILIFIVCLTVANIRINYEIAVSRETNAKLQGLIVTIDSIQMHLNEIMRLSDENSKTIAEIMETNRRMSIPDSYPKTALGVGSSEGEPPKKK